MDQQELNNVLDLHRKWVLGEESGKRADLRGAYLQGADLRGAYLRGAYLRGAYLQPIKDDLFLVLEKAPGEVLGLLDALERGLVDGTIYEGECACLIGTIANLRHEDYEKLSIDLRPGSNRPAERWFLAIGKGDTPRSNPVAAITAEWLREWLSAKDVKYPRYEIHAVWDAPIVDAAAKESP